NAMPLTLRDNSGNPVPVTATLVAIALFAPAAIVSLPGIFNQVEVPQRIWIGAGMAAILGLIHYRQHGVRAFRQVSVVSPSVLSMLCLWLAKPEPRSGITHLAYAGLLLIAAGSFAIHAAALTGAIALRRSRKLAKQLAARNEWPTTLSACRTMPDV